MAGFSRRPLPFLILALALAGAIGVTTWRASARSTNVAASATFVALGASDAVGIGATRPMEDGWAPLVAAGLPAGTRLVNLGVSGATLGDVLADQVPVALDAESRWVAIWPGPNDLRNGIDMGQFARQLDQLLGQLAGPGVRPGARTVAVMNLPDLRLLPSFARVEPAILDARVREWNAVIAETVERHAPVAILVDLYSGWQELAAHPEYISADGFHPSSAGYRRVADLALAVLRQRDR